MDYIYLGSFPHPYGGVTIKNDLIYKNLINYVDCNKVDFSEIKRKNKSEIFKFIRSIFNKNAIYIVGVSGNKTRERLLKLLLFLNKKAVKKSIIIVMGGAAHKTIVSDSNYSKIVRNFKKIYVETEGMKKHLNNGGIFNVDIFPNCREVPKKMEFPATIYRDELRCLFFSRISEEKGVDIIIEAALLLEARGVNFSVDFYGVIDENYHNKFQNQIKDSNKLTYRGVFKSTEENVYSKLSEYDLLLFPTRWKAEGIPGILVESKIASLPAIVSNQNFNAEIITDEVDGVILRNNSSIELCDKIEHLYKNKNLLVQYQKNAKNSAKYYYIENHINKILIDLKMKKGI